MDTVDRIETTRFIGTEFLAWLWFKIELFDGHFELEDDRTCDLWLDTRISLAGWADDGEKTTLAGKEAAHGPEASVALERGKVPTSASLRLVLGDEEFAFTFDAKKFTLSGVTAPQLTATETDERLYERMMQLEKLDGIIGQLYDEFLSLRLSRSWDAEVAPALRKWVKGKRAMSTEEYGELVRRARQAARRRARG